MSKSTAIIQLAVLSDIHGNLPALEAVVADIKRRKIERVLNLGDHASGPLWPSETVAFLMRQPWLHISGNCDRQIVRLRPAQQGLSDRYACDALTTSQKEWLKQLPKTLSVKPAVLMTHGTPKSDNRYLLESVVDGQVRLATQSEISTRLGRVSETVVLCGHTHVPRIVSAADKLIINPGSVGLSAYDSDQPEPHLMESGSVHARFGVLTFDAGQWRIELVAVEYDHRSAAHKAQSEQRTDWANALLTGHALA